MRVAFDTSVVIGGLVAGHVHGDRAQPWLQAARRGEVDASIACHALAEAWATLTAIPVEPPVSPSNAQTLLDALCRHVKPVALTLDDYKLAVQRCCDAGLRSGAIYDALHLVVAERCGADAFLTFNRKDFERLAVERSPSIIVPPDPPGLGDLER